MKKISIEEAIAMINRMIDPDPWEDDLTETAKAALRMALSALKKETPIKPEAEFMFTNTARNYLETNDPEIAMILIPKSNWQIFVCPSCGEPITYIRDKNYNVEHHHHCLNCFQTLNWDFLEEENNE